MCAYVRADSLFYGITANSQPCKVIRNAIDVRTQCAGLLNSMRSHCSPAPSRKAIHLNFGGVRGKFVNREFTCFEVNVNGNAAKLAVRMPPSVLYCHTSCHFGRKKVLRTKNRSKHPTGELSKCAESFFLEESWKSWPDLFFGLNDAGEDRTPSELNTCGTTGINTSEDSL